MCVTGQVPGLSLPLELLEHLEAVPKSRGARWHFPFQLWTFWKRSQGVQGESPAPVPAHVLPRWERQRLSVLSRDPHCHGQLKPERNPRLHARGKSQGAPTVPVWPQSHTEGGAGCPAWLLCRDIGLFCSLRVGSAFPAAISPCCGISTARAGVRVELVAEKSSLDPATQSD